MRFLKGVVVATCLVGKAVARVLDAVVNLRVFVVMVGFLALAGVAALFLETEGDLTALAAFAAVVFFFLASGVEVFVC